MEKREQNGVREVPDRAEPPGMSVIVQTVTRWVKGFIFFFGVYIVLFGHLTPGGGFAGGVIIACAYVLITLAFGKERGYSLMPKGVAMELDSLGALGFLALAVAGIGTVNVFFANWIHQRYTGTAFQKAFHLFSAGFIPLANIAIGLKVGASLFMVFIILAVVRVVETDKGRRMVQKR